MDRCCGNYHGDCLVGDPSTLSSLKDTFKWNKKDDGDIDVEMHFDCGAQKRVDGQGRSVPRWNAQAHFGLKGNKLVVGGLRPSHPAPSTWNTSESSSSSSSSARTANSSSSSSSSTGNRTFNMADPFVVGLSHKWVIFRYADELVQNKKEETKEFFLQCGYIVEVNPDPENPKSFKPRCTGETKRGSDGKDVPIEEKWTVALKRFKLQPFLTGNDKRPLGIKKVNWGYNPGVIEYEKRTNHSTYFMSKKVADREDAKFKGKSKGLRESVTYLDFDNPEHGLTLLHEDARFDSNGKKLFSSVLNDLLVNKPDSITIQQMKLVSDSLLADKKAEEERKSAKKAVPKAKAPKAKASSSSSSQASSSSSSSSHEENKSNTPDVDYWINMDSDDGSSQGGNVSEEDKGSEFEEDYSRREVILPSSEDTVKLIDRMSMRAPDTSIVLVGSSSSSIKNRYEANDDDVMEFPTTSRTVKKVRIQ